VRVIFPGYVTGALKQAFFRIADVYLFPSRHESYGLTLVEALGAGLPAICRDHAGARQILRPEFGIRVEGSGSRARAAFLQALAGLLADEPKRAAMAAAAREWARQRPFAASAATLASWLAGTA
jgi:glycosyltransferase involved in cell wall biosynthesis